MDQYYEAKRRLFVEHEPAPAAAINVGDEWGRRLAAELRVLDRAPILTYGLVGDAELRWEDVDVETRLYGRFNRENMLAAVAVSRLLGVPAAAIEEGLSRLPGVPGRFESVDEGQPFAVLVDYAHTPDSLANVLRTARELTGGQLICVFGCGGDRDRGKRPEMGRIASELADIAIVTSDNPRSEDPLAIIEEILAGVAEDVQVEPDRRAAIALAVEQAGERDVVVIAGKGHEQGQEFADRKVPFDDREVARDALRRLGAPA
jgi:UDP-N-acetylmuramoyl-L-alanyl-D-glutamate--2,6-diaminopimelate ligase